VHAQSTICPFHVRNSADPLPVLRCRLFFSSLFFFLSSLPSPHASGHPFLLVIFERRLNFFVSSAKPTPCCGGIEFYPFFFPLSAKSFSSSPVLTPLPVLQIPPRAPFRPVPLSSSSHGTVTIFIQTSPRYLLPGAFPSDNAGSVFIFRCRRLEY